MKNARGFIIVAVCLIISFTIAMPINYSNSNVIEYSFALEILITIFSLSLAVLAIFFTVIEKKTDKLSSKANMRLKNITNELGEDIKLLLVLSAILFGSSLFEDLLPQNLNEWVIISCYILGFVGAFDVLNSTIKIMRAISDLE